MERHQQTVEEIKSKLAIIDSEWKDEFASKVIWQLDKMEEVEVIDNSVLIEILKSDFEVGLTILRLFLEKSKDEFRTILRMSVFDEEETSGKTLFNKDPAYFVDQLSKLNILEIINSAKNRIYSWNDIIVERLKGGRGSAIKGQLRGRYLEDFVEDIVKNVFGQYDSRCNFSGKIGQIAKADFAIPNKDNPSIVIEVKAYGATGSKQTDSIGDVDKIIKNKRHDTYFLFVTDGITWLDRISDLRKIVYAQNEGDIYRIYTESMRNELFADLSQIKKEINL